MMGEAIILFVCFFFFFCEGREECYRQHEVGNKRFVADGEEGVGRGRWGASANQEESMVGNMYS